MINHSYTVFGYFDNFQCTKSPTNGPLKNRLLAVYFNFFLIIHYYIVFLYNFFSLKIFLISEKKKQIWIHENLRNTIF